MRVCFVFFFFFDIQLFATWVGFILCKCINNCLLYFFTSCGSCFFINCNFVFLFGIQVNTFILVQQIQAFVLIVKRKGNNVERELSRKYIRDIIGKMVSGGWKVGSPSTAAIAFDTNQMEKRKKKTPMNVLTRLGVHSLLFIWTFPMIVSNWVSPFGLHTPNKQLRPCDYHFELWYCDHCQYGKETRNKC